MLPSPKPEMSADDTNMTAQKTDIPAKRRGGAKAARLAGPHSTGMTLSPS